MRFPTELRIFVEKPKPKTFMEYIIDQLVNGRDINFRKKEEFDMLELLQEKKAQLQAELDKPISHEEEIAKKVAEFEAGLRKDYADIDATNKSKLVAQIEVVDELIEKQTQNLSADADTEQNEDCVATNEVTEQGE